MEPLCRLLQTWDGVWNGAGRWLLHCGDAAGLFFVSPSLSFLFPPSPHLCCYCCHAAAMALFHTVTILNRQSRCCIWFIFGRHDLDSNEALFCPQHHQPPSEPILEADGRDGPIVVVPSISSPGRPTVKITYSSLDPTGLFVARRIFSVSNNQSTNLGIIQQSSLLSRLGRADDKINTFLTNFHI